MDRYHKEAVEEIESMKHSGRDRWKSGFGSAGKVGGGVGRGLYNVSLKPLGKLAYHTGRLGVKLGCGAGRAGLKGAKEAVGNLAEEGYEAGKWLAMKGGRLAYTGARRALDEGVNASVYATLRDDAEGAGITPEGAARYAVSGEAPLVIVGAGEGEDGEDEAGVRRSALGWIDDMRGYKDLESITADSGVDPATAVYAGIEKMRRAGAA